MPPLASGKTFRNEPTKRFYNFLQEKIDNKNITPKEVGDLFKKKEGEISNPSVFLSQLRTGRNSITVEQIIVAQNRLNLSPAFLFGESQTNGETVANEENVVYSLPGDSRIGNLLHDIFKKHHTEIKSYAANRLNYTEQQLHNIFSGRSRVFFDVVLTICEDHAESLDQLRTRPLPKGHLIEENKNLRDVVQAQKVLIETLQKQHQ